ncbi:MAG: YdeI/OmpD-associated family protein [Paracoccaceae bacterium]
MADTVRFRAAAEAEAALPALRRYLHAAKDLAEKGPAAPKAPTPLALPVELREILQGDRQLAEAFERLTPGRQRSYAILLSSAKTSQTRIARIARKRAAIMAGKGANER